MGSARPGKEQRGLASSELSARSRPWRKRQLGLLNRAEIQRGSCRVGEDVLQRSVDALGKEYPADFEIESVGGGRKSFSVMMRTWIPSIEEDKLESRTTQMQEGEDDEDMSTINTSTPQIHMHETQLSRIMRRNRKEAYSRWAKFGLQKGLNLWWPTYGDRFWCSNTRWKAYEVYFHMDPVPCPYL